MEIFNTICKSLTALFIVLCICATIVNVTDKQIESVECEKFTVGDVMFDTYVVIAIETEGESTLHEVYDQESHIMYRIIESNGNYSIVPIYDESGNVKKYKSIIQDTIPDDIRTPDMM